MKNKRLLSMALCLACLVALLFLALSTSPGQSLLRRVSGSNTDALSPTQATASSSQAAETVDLYQLRKAIRELEMKIANQKRVSGSPTITQDFTDAKSRYEAEESMLQQMQAKVDEEIRAGTPEERLVELRKAVQTQEETVEQCRKMLANIVRAKGIVYREGEDSPFKAHDPAAVRRDIEADQAKLRQLKLKLRDWAPPAEPE